MKNLRNLALLVVAAHWITAIWHLFLAARVLPSPNNGASWLAIVLISSGHLVVSVALRSLKDRPSGFVSLLFFLAALGADVYEHLLHASPNNVFMVANVSWTTAFDASVLILLILEILGCFLGSLLVGWQRGQSQRSQEGGRKGPSRTKNMSRQVTEVVIASFRPLYRTPHSRV